MFKLIFAPLVEFWWVQFPPGVLVRIFPKHWLASVCGIWTKKSGSTKKPERPQPERLRQPRKIEKYIGAF